MNFRSRALERFDTVSWPRISERVAEYTAAHYPAMADLVEAVRAGAADRLAGLTSMHDLGVTTTPVPAGGQIDVIWVRPQPFGASGVADVLIEHWAASGWDERVVRPGDQTVPLFWRFAREKWGIEPSR
ncbi:hypothetical protein AB0J83_25250 [Actinoplanes sp. NPDC049596]|uniref:hypothetical protein n=1 Tax=unclassified Actinoplanes TaxID=2626549 RepID=UPI00341545CC